MESLQLAEFCPSEKKKHQSAHVVVHPLKAPGPGHFMSTDCVIRHACVLHAKLPVRISFIKTEISKYNNKFQICIYLYGKLLI